MLRKTLAALLLGAAAINTVQAADASLTIDIPALQVAEYHRPYIAAWLMPEGGREVTNLALWYQMDDKREGEKWLKDLRQWWRRSGRSLEMPVDGFTGATRAPGEHRIALGDAFSALAPGEYTLYVEASREVGGRELLRLPFSWPVSGAATLEARGDSELGSVVLELAP
ncbi:DUF2271 domain-containing protein [Haliea atlantica]